MILYTSSIFCVWLSVFWTINVETFASYKFALWIVFSLRSLEDMKPFQSFLKLRNSSIIASSHFISCTSSGYEQLAEVSEPQSTMSDQICSACETKAEFSLNCCSMNNLIEAMHTGTFHLVYDHSTIHPPLMVNRSLKRIKISR